MTVIGLPLAEAIKIIQKKLPRYKIYIDVDHGYSCLGYCVYLETQSNIVVGVEVWPPSKQPI